jgi:hypothetical protein
LILFKKEMTRPIKDALSKNRGLLGIAIAGVAIALVFIPSTISGIFLTADNALAQQGGARCTTDASGPTGNPHTYQVCTGNPHNDPDNPSKGNPHNVDNNGPSAKGNAHKI